VPEDDRVSVVQALGIDPLKTQGRHVVFFDTHELA
jgi:hypothetical protein